MYCTMGLPHAVVRLVPSFCPSFPFVIPPFPTHCKFVTYSSEVIFPNLHISIEDHPLGGFKTELRCLRGVGLHTLFSYGKVESLSSSFLEIKLVSKRLLLGLFLSLHYKNLNLFRFQRDTKGTYMDLYRIPPL